MNSPVKIAVSILLCFACAVTVLTSCTPPSLLIKGEETTKEAFNEQEFDAEYYKTTDPTTTTESTTESTTEETTSVTETETESVTEKVTEITTVVSTTIKKKVTTTAPTTKHVVDTKIDSKETTSNFKYGVKKITHTTIYYDVYSDGSKVQTKKNVYDTYDTSGFKAKTNALLSDAKANKSTYSAEITNAVNTVNGYRTAKSVTELTVDDALTNAACVRALEMAYSSSTNAAKRPDKSEYYTVLTDLSIDYKSAVNLTCRGNYSSGAKAMEAIKSTKSNYNAMVKSAYTKIGVGAAASPDGKTIYWVIFLLEEK